ncbi:hypothetical protein [Limosilactobacillus vaginalis]|uniref:hypothetical protein n=1 Tax=Limosilactobacillus vaginalis TaxID=1633 RepID=UPI0025A42BF5|nr:hypothetical protein [Limosilactobacillus vaginalis]MDM8259558.1 hypothetical protein [Limosilactobacillus vaginalis]
MKKIGLFCATALLGMSLTACGSQSTKQASSSSKASSSKVVKHHKKANRHSEKERESSSSNSSSVASSSSQQATNQQAQENNNQQASASNNGQLPPSTDLHDFVNRYGESPAAYLMEHNGMSAQQAVQSVPNDMKTSGEIQDTYQLQQGQDPFNQ